MTYGAAAAVSHPNIAFNKYWGNRQDDLRLPANGSISMTLGALLTRTSVRFDPQLGADQLTVNGQPPSAGAPPRGAGAAGRAGAGPAGLLPGRPSRIGLGRPLSVRWLRGGVYRRS